MERTCQAQLLAMAAGDPVSIPDDVARLTYRQVGSHVAGWFSAQPLFDWILAPAARPARLTAPPAPPPPDLPPPSDPARSRWP